MTEVSTIRGRSALDAIRHPGRHGKPNGTAGVAVAERQGLAIASIAARKDQAAALGAKIEARTGLVLPTKPRVVTRDHLSFAWTAPGQWLAVADGEDGSAFAQDLARDLAGLAAVTDQSDGRVVLRVSGPDVRTTLAKGCMIDLHPAVFRVGDTAVTPIALLTTQISRVGDDTYDLMIMRSFATNLWHWLEASAAEFGLDVA